MPIDLIHPHISHNDNYFIINPTVYRTNLLQFLHSCLGSSNSSSNATSTFQPPITTAIPLKPLQSPSSDLILCTTGPQAPNITLTPSPTCFANPAPEQRQDGRFLRVPRTAKAKRSDKSLRCGCVRCGKKRNAKIAELKRRRKRVFVRREGVDEGERSEIED